MTCEGIDVSGGVTICAEAQAPLAPAAIARLRVQLVNWSVPSVAALDYAARCFGADGRHQQGQGLGSTSELLRRAFSGSVL